MWWYPKIWTLNRQPHAITVQVFLPQTPHSGTIECCSDSLTNYVNVEENKLPPGTLQTWCSSPCFGDWKQTFLLLLVAPNPPQISSDYHWYESWLILATDRLDRMFSSDVFFQLLIPALNGFHELLLVNVARACSVHTPQIVPKPFDCTTF